MIYLDSPDSMLTTVEKLGRGRLVFGSHAPWMNLEFEIERINRLSITDEQRADIFGLTILKLLGRS